MPRSRKKTSVPVNTKLSYGYTGKGTALATALQVDLESATGVPTTDIVFGMNNKKPIYMKKCTATGCEFEMVAPSAVTAMKAEGYEVTKAGYNSVRTIGGTAANTSTRSEVMHAKLTSTCTYQWSRTKKTPAVPVAAETALKQVKGVGPVSDETVIGASAFIFKTEYAGVPAGTLIGRKGINARFRYAPASETSTGVYTSVCGDVDPV
jgi:hypothetical protein